MERLVIRSAARDAFPEGRKLLAEWMIEIEGMREKAQGQEACRRVECDRDIRRENIVAQAGKGDLSFTGKVKSLLKWSS